MIGLGIKIDKDTVLFVPETPTTSQEKAIHILNAEKNKYKDALEDVWPAVVVGDTDSAMRIIKQALKEEQYG